VTVTAAGQRNVGDFSAAPYDGAIDFQGASGKDFGNRSASATRSVTLTGAAMNAFLGTGQVNLTESLTASSTANGGGNVAVQIATTASARATVIYHYLPSNCIRPGNYTVVEVTEPPGNYLDGKDSRNGTVLGNPPGTNVIPITVTAEGVYPHNDFGKVLPPPVIAPPPLPPPGPPPAADLRIIKTASAPAVTVGSALRSATWGPTPPPA
jgi:hypothetical protein